MKYLYVKSVFLWLSAVSVALLGACSGESFEPSYDDEGAIRFSTPQTRAAIEDASKMESFSVWGWYRNTATGGTPISVFNNTIVTQSSGWNYEGGTRYWIPGNTYNFYAVHPTGKGSYNSEGVLTVPSFDCSATGQNAIDLMTAVSDPIKYEKGQTPEPVELHFGHRLVRLNFIVTSEGDAVTITEAKIYGMSHVGSLQADSWSLGDVSTSDGTPFKTDELVIPEGDKNDYYLFGGDMLLPPHNSLKGVMLEFKYRYSNEQEEHPVAISLGEQNVATSWEAGKRYNYNINIPLNAVDVEFTVAVKDWDNDSYTVNW